MACPVRAEKLVHGLHRCIRDYWKDGDFVACKVDLRNAFNEVTRKGLLEECATHFPELFRWVFGAMGSILFCGTPWVPLGQSRELSRGTLWVLSYSH